MGIKFSNRGHISIVDNTKIEKHELIELLSKDVLENQRTLGQVLICQIRDENPEAVRFAIDKSTTNSILFNLKKEDYGTIIDCYGNLFLLELLKICEDFELYEVCGKMKQAIECHNKLVNNNAPTR